MLAYCVHILARIRPLSLKLFRGPLYFACFIIFFSFTTYYNEKAGTSQARTCSFYVDHFIHRFYASFHFFLLHYILYFVIFAVLLLCCIVFFFNNMDFIYICFLLFILYFSSFPFFHFFPFIFRIVVLLAFASIFSIFKLFHFLCLLRYLISVQQQLIVFVYHHVLYI